MVCIRHSYIEGSVLAKKLYGKCITFFRKNVTNMTSLSHFHTVLYESFSDKILWVLRNSQTKLTASSV
jgi:hypothetical protein